ncbi:type II toxin-antitoxin system RelE/ParE family toxin [Erwinia pyrifoliae]|uniref:Type II toxin-antitoxin system RelE/ParE family toxin n=1 Tax=Erwinia pyrifoliae TaxID=79967 RepID=A0ABY5X7W0_ERWPY|nr:type II toxin-antitoxin system RelE/ParE family toxin [Erwinia pyrifoliae]AUX71380.1 type II toxin-antitoxin system RelE/ParE family toxin [Erwinia pyrifoliae]MCA8874889.1 type II toxin-antitoxin system RelE/ParE family toxin [Erwinia pyrifoliae]MCT2387449.1 type II toxin-antitoxin system RelE/ParE family toxin [Erwinia pyrifoliae]MCU8585704.1 type II toxin-antitoxin system RelE/ParE family toxin [Erwinia pyrifoliae]UWS28997.1 type II toxin-antitoxin system RelE/ParE family toxin [Erwinia p
MKLSISPLAEQDIEAIGDYIAQDNPVRAMSFTEELYRKCLRIGEAPQLYRERPELGPQIRSCAYGRYLILFSTGDTEARIERVLHAARDIGEILAPE